MITVSTRMLALVTALAGCSLEMLRDSTAPPGLINAEGKINPCHGDEADHQRCGDAIFNGRHIGKIAIGSDAAEVRRVMLNEPDDKSVVRDGETVIERWTYLTDYRRRGTTTVLFRDGRVDGFEVGTSRR
jgi:hypothetical protein